MTADPHRLIAAHAAAIDFYRQHLLDNDTARLYLARRGFAILALRDLPWQPGIDKPWRIGYAPATWTALTDHLIHKGFTTAELVTAGLARTATTGRAYDTFRDRIMFPIRSADGEPIAFTGRALYPSDKAPKYLNTPDSPIFHKGQHLYGLAEQHDRLHAGGAPVIVEGPLDVHAVWLAHPDGAGLPRVALAACGTALTPNHIALLTALPGITRHGITTAYDNDTAGRAATERAWNLLHTIKGLPLRAAVLPDGADPADLTTHPDRVAALRAGLTHEARPLLEAVIDQHLDQFINRHADTPDSPELRVAAVRNVAHLLTHMPPDDSHRIVKHVAGITGAAPEVVTSAIIAAFDQEDAGHPGSPPATAQPPPSRPRAGRAFP
ncbi:MAG: primase, partial [Micromonosporaceae bacterium]|nr:primase [Micromonosporaceae bacterium]